MNQYECLLELSMQAIQGTNEIHPYIEQDIGKIVCVCSLVK